MDKVGKGSLYSGTKFAKWGGGGKVEGGGGAFWERERDKWSDVGNCESVSGGGILKVSLAQGVLVGKGTTRWNFPSMG